ncbi:MAG: EAL and HDOD domain-containing protein, partial [Flavonifractor plautii]
PYVAEKLTTQTHSSGYLQSNFFRLMVAMTRDEPDVEEIEQIISVDATLTYGLLRMANSCYYALRHRVTSVRQAIMTMGLSELRQWVYLLSASNAENQMEEGAEEFLRMSFMRANFCSKLMNYAKDMPISKPDAYLMGMFSTLNYLIDAPLAEILKPIPLCAEAKEALLQHTGRAGMLYDLALSYEHADWEKIDRLTGELGIPTNLLTSLYFTCMEEVNRVWIEMNRPVQGQITDDTKIDT